MQTLFIDSNLRRNIWVICLWYVTFLLVWQYAHCIGLYFQNLFIYLHFVVAEDTVLLSSSKTKLKLFKWCCKRFRSTKLEVQILETFMYAWYFQIWNFTTLGKIILSPALCFFTIWKIISVACLKFQFVFPGQLNKQKF